MEQTSHTLTRVDRSPVTTDPRSRPVSSHSKYLATAASDQSGKDVTDTNSNRRIPDMNLQKRNPEPMSLRWPKMENTYKLGPDTEIQFRESRVKKAVESLLDVKMTDMTYDPVTLSKMTSELSDAVLSRIKTLGFKRHKFVVHVAMGNVQGQGLHVVSRCLSDDKTDGHVTVKYRNKELYALVIVYAIYFE